MRRLLTLFCLCLIVVGAHAEDRMEHGDWSSQFLDGMGEASTHENGESMFGMLCAAGSCRYYFANGIDCEAGNNYPLMVTTAAGALAFDAICEPMNTANGDVMLYWFNEAPRLNEAFGQSMAVGFAFPMTDGQFKISKFSMKGYEQAIERMVNGMRAKREAESNPEGSGRT
jgi:hypothetical protein